MFCFLPTSASSTSIVTGSVRIQFLSPSLIRVEQRGPLGFEDRATFVVENRAVGIGPAIHKRTAPDGSITVSGGNFRVFVPAKPSSLVGIGVFDSQDHLLYRFTGTLPKNGYLPPPGAAIPVWTLTDSPRLAPPVWGATPAPKSVLPDLAETSGWDKRNDAPDVYLFAPGSGGYKQLRSDFLALTGAIPKPPLSILGFVDSRWYPYTEREALASIDAYRARGIPLDTFVVDTDWRVSGSDGYTVESKYFPDMPRFIKEAHERHVKLMFNDHPRPVSKGATDPAELKFRYDGLTKLLDWGLDYWWYDRNWSTSLAEPAPGIAKEVWGQRLYHDVTMRDRPNRRPWIMTNAEGIDNGHVDYPPNPAGHRYPMMWTGDTGSRFEFLNYGVKNGVDRGVESLQPYTHEDLGGHVGPTPSPELYVRYLEYGCLSPITRVHCTLGQDRHPWAFGQQAERIVRDYIKLRYRLLPTLYSAAQRTTDDGTPILRRCDLEWPEYKEASADDQYLLADDLLVAPIVNSIAGDPKPIPVEMLRTPEGQPGLKAEYFDNKDLQGTPKVIRTDSNIDFDWSGHGPAEGVSAENFSVRWTGSLGPIPATGSYTLTTLNDDGVRVFVDDKPVLDDWKPEDSITNEVKLEFAAGSIHTFRIEYLQIGGQAVLKLGWKIPGSEADPMVSHRSVWIPPGMWQDLWTRSTVEGPKTMDVSAGLARIPMWARVGGIILSGPDLQYTGEKREEPIVANLYLGGSTTQMRELDEDDGISNEYLKGAVGRTSLTLTDSGKVASLAIGPRRGRYKSMPGARSWRISIHFPPGRSVSEVLVDGKRSAIEANQTDGGMPFEASGGAVSVAVAASSPTQGHLVRISY